MDENPFRADPPDDAGMTIVVEPKKWPKKRTGKEKERKRQGIPRYNVLLWDDDDHSYEYVIVMLRELFGHPLEKCFLLTKTVDTAGRAVVLTTTKEHAELKQEQIHTYGKDESIQACQGSMTASIEPIE